jgi:hypothetical protein
MARAHVLDWNVIGGWGLTAAPTKGFDRAPPYTCQPPRLEQPVGLPTFTYLQVVGAGAEDKDEPQSQLVVQDEPLPLQGSQSPLMWQQEGTILPTRPREGTGHDAIMI